MPNLDPCPRCLSDRNADTSEAIQKLHNAGRYGVMHDPGGIQLTFDDGRRLRLQGQCNSCDIVKIEKFLAT